MNIFLDEIIKLNKKSKKKQQGAGGRKKNQTFRPQNKIKQFRGKPCEYNLQKCHDIFVGQLVSVLDMFDLTWIN